MIAATGLLNGPPHFLHWGVIQISVANLIVIVLMVVLFVLALVVPFPGSRAGTGHRPASGKPSHRSDPEDGR